MAGLCEHLQFLAAPHRPAVKPSGHCCKECLASGDDWVHLRLCMHCGQVGCCDSSPNQHASKHAHKAGHPVIRSYEPGEEWAYCYPDDAMVDGVPFAPGEAALQHYSAP